MSTAPSSTAALTRWLPADQFRALGFGPGGPETDYGMRWGERGDIRVSYAPHTDQDGGFLYAHDPATDRYLLLVTQTTQRQVETAWQELTAATTEPDGYLALALLAQQPAAAPVEQAQDLLLHCLDRELRAYRQFVIASADELARFDAAFAVVVHRSARVSAEQLLIDATRAQCADSDPVVVRYRLGDEPGWSGRIAGSDLDAACGTTKRAVELAREHEVRFQATSVATGRTTLAAARVPELDFAATRPPLGVDAPAIGI